MSAQVGTNAMRRLSGIFNKATRADLSQLAQQQQQQQQEPGEAEDNKKTIRFWNVMFQRPIPIPVPEEIDGSTKTSENTSTPYTTEEIHTTLALNVSGVDEATLESYTQFLKRAAAVVTPNTMCKIVPMIPNSGKLLASDALYSSRMLLVHELRGEAAQSFLHYIHENKPDGVSLIVDEKSRWE